MKIQKTIFLIFFLNCFYFLVAQEDVKLNLNSNGHFTLTKLPFDKPFTLTIPNSPGIIDLSYTLKDKSNIKWHYMSTDTSGTVSNYFPSQSFNLGIGPLHPNTPYELTITAKATPKITDKEALKKKLLETMQKHIENNADFGIREESALKTALINVFNKELGQEGRFLEYESGNTISFAPYSSLFANLTNTIQETDAAINDLKNELNGIENKLSKKFGSNWSSIRPELYNLSKDTASLELDINSKIILQELVSPNLKNFATLTISDACKVLWKLTLEKNKIGDILAGKWKLNGKTDLPTDTFDESSFLFIYASLQILKESQLKKTDGTNVFSNDQKKQIELVINNIDTIQAKKRALLIENKKRAQQINLFPDLFYNTFRTTKFTIKMHPKIDMIAKNSPYVGVDLGVGYAFKLKRVVTYQGINLHLTPVDKNIPLSTYKNWDIPLKLTSVFFGVTQILNGDEEAYEKYTSIGNPTIGIGLRFSNIFRLNFGGVLIKAKNADPIVTTTTDKFTPTLSISIDTAFKDLIKGVSGFIK